MNNFIQIFGGFGLFIYGMKLMSDSLQMASSSSLRKIISTMTKNKFLGVFSGLLVTSLIQSSSATTVMVVSFVNAGLLKLVEAISIIMGANIGTTFTAWIISFLGFKFKINLFALPAIGFGLIMLFSRNSKVKIWGEIFIGFGLLFLGLSFLKKGIPDVKAHPEVLSFLSHYTSAGFWSILLFVGIGTLITVIIQSSSATMALTITMSLKGWIPFDIAAAMVLGENVGTTITAVFASIPANRLAKRAALSHAIFNFFGVIWMLTLFYPVIRLVDFLWPGDPISNISSVKYHLSLFHTLFNCCNMLLLIWFIPHIAKVVSSLIPSGEEEGFHLKYIASPLHLNPEIGVIEAQKETHRMGEIVQKMYKDTIDLVLSPDKKMGKVIDKIKRYEILTDMLEKEISDFLSKLVGSEISNRSAKKVTSVFNVVNELERIADCCYNLTKLAQRKYEQKKDFTDHMKKEFVKISDSVKEFLQTIKEGLDSTPVQDLMISAKYYEEKINEQRDKIKKEHTKDLVEGKGDVISRLILMDMINNLEKIGDYSYNVAQALSGEK